MTILDRVKERLETDLSDDEIQMIIDEVNQDVIDRFGPHPTNPITVWLEGRCRELVVARSIDTTQPVAIIEYITEYGWGETPYTLDPIDYRIWPGGSIIERLTTGYFARSKWPDRVQITYTPVSNANQREEVIIKVVMLSIEYQGGVRSKTVGELSVSSPDYRTERESIMSTLTPRGGLLMT